MIAVGPVYTRIRDPGQSQQIRDNWSLCTAGRDVFISEVGLETVERPQTVTWPIAESQVEMARAIAILVAGFLAAATATPLDDYVNKPDATYEYRDLGNPYRGDGFTSYFVNMTSQTWLSGELRIGVRYRSGL